MVSSALPEVALRDEMAVDASEEVESGRTGGVWT
jgi:hypothetical protein